ncbi:MAG: DUF123 domain-containing protein [Candidatus Diapherotrites archaeon]|nr:DUF123 domain-containing protein [Candidatus Diapherotrites archaeon]
MFAVRKQANVKTTYGFTKLKPGIYAYVGSAFGPGGLKARILRHWRQEKKIHWHIDWITKSEACEHIGAFVFVGKRIESEIAGLLERKYKAVPGFGASDSKEDSHLFKIC